MVESVQKAVEEALLGCNVSRTYYTQALLPTPISLQTAEGERTKKGTSSGIVIPTHYLYISNSTGTSVVLLAVFSHTWFFQELFSNAIAVLQ